MKYLLLTALAIAFAPAAHADGFFNVCDYLDAHPNVAGVEDVVGIFVAQGSTQVEAFKSTVSIVSAACPRHTRTVQDYALDQS